MNDNSSTSVSEVRPTHEQIALRAELLWKAQGTPSGRDEQIWLEAERQLFDEGREVIGGSDSRPPQTPRSESPAEAIQSAPSNSKKNSSNGSTRRRGSSGR